MRIQAYCHGWRDLIVVLKVVSGGGRCPKQCSENVVHRNGGFSRSNKLGMSSFPAIKFPVSKHKNKTKKDTPSVALFFLVVIVVSVRSRINVIGHIVSVHPSHGAAWHISVILRQGKEKVSGEIRLKRFTKTKKDTNEDRVEGTHKTGHKAYLLNGSSATSAVDYLSKRFLKVAVALHVPDEGLSVHELVSSNIETFTYSMATHGGGKVGVRNVVLEGDRKSFIRIEFQEPAPRKEPRAKAGNSRKERAKTTRKQTREQRKENKMNQSEERSQKGKIARRDNIRHVGLETVQDFVSDGG